MKNINGAMIQGANHSDFSDAKTLYEISNFNSTQIKVVSLKSHKKFKYVRFILMGKKHIWQNCLFMMEIKNCKVPL